MQLILYSPDIWVLHANILRYIALQYVTPQIMEIVNLQHLRLLEVVKIFSLPFNFVKCN